jgi:tyrosinase
VPVRHEIRDLQQNYPEQWDLFCLGLLAFQNMDESDQLSYYEVSGESFILLRRLPNYVFPSDVSLFSSAGIHGLPYRAWNGVTGIDGQQTGYCTHSSILFLPWHRPYLCLFEVRSP